MATAIAAKQILVDGQSIVVSGGVESISLVQNQHMNLHRAQDEWIVEHRPDLYMSMLETAELDAERYGVTREQQDAYALQSQQRTAEALAAGRYDAEIMPIPTRMRVTPNEGGQPFYREVTLQQDEAPRPQTTMEDLAKLCPAFGGGQQLEEGKSVTAGNSSQLSDGAVALVLMERAEVERHNVTPLGAYRGMAVAGCDPDEMGIGPVFAVPKLLAAQKLKMEDIGIWELNEAFASQVIYCRDKLGIPNELLNVSGGAIAIGHPYGMSGGRMIGLCSSKESVAARAMASSPCVSAAAWVRPVCSKSIEFRGRHDPIRALARAVRKAQRSYRDCHHQSARGSQCRQWRRRRGAGEGGRTDRERS